VFGAGRFDTVSGAVRARTSRTASTPSSSRSRCWRPAATAATSARRRPSGSPAAPGSGARPA